MSPLIDNHVEIETAQPVLILRVVDDTDRRSDADPLQRRLEEQRDALGRRILPQDFDGDRLAGGIDELFIAHLVACFLQQPRAFA